MSDEWDRQHRHTRAMALADATVRALNRKKTQATVQGEEITYTYLIEATMMDDNSIAVEMEDEDSCDIYKFTLRVE